MRGANEGLAARTGCRLPFAGTALGSAPISSLRASTMMTPAKPGHSLAPMRSNTVNLALGGLLAVLLAAAGWYALSAKGAWTAAPEPYALRPDDPQTVQAGARIYAQHCE